MFAITKKKSEYSFRTLLNSFVTTGILLSFLAPHLLFEPMLEFDDFGQWLIKAKVFWLEGIYPSFLHNKITDVNFGVTNLDYPPFLTFIHVALYGLGTFIRTSDIVKLISVISFFVLIQELVEETITRKRNKMESWIGFWNLLLWLGIYVLYIRGFINTSMSDAFYAFLIFRIYKNWKANNNSLRFWAFASTAILRPGSFLWLGYPLLMWRKIKVKKMIGYLLMIVPAFFLSNIYNYLGHLKPMTRALNMETFFNIGWVMNNSWIRIWNLSPVLLLVIMSSLFVAIFSKRIHFKLSSSMIFFNFLLVCFLIGVAFGDYERHLLKSFERYLFHCFGVYVCYTYYIFQSIFRYSQRSKPALKL